MAASLVGQVGAGMNGEHESRSRVNYRWIVAGILVVIGSFLLAVYDRHPPGGNEAEGYRTIGWSLILGSIFVVRHLGKRLLIFIPATYLAAIVLSLAFSPLAYQWVHRAELAECRGWDDYVDDFTAQGEAFNARMAGVRDLRDLPPRQLEFLITATERDLETLNSLDPPKAIQAAHRQHIQVMSGWITVYEALRDGSFTMQVLFDLQAEDDEEERLVSQANDRCTA